MNIQNSVMVGEHFIIFPLLMLKCVLFHINKLGGVAVLNAVVNAVWLWARVLFTLCLQVGR